MKYLSIENSLFVKNRSLFTKHLKANSVAIFNSNDIMPTNADGTMPFRQNNDLFWLTGIDQEESTFVIVVDKQNRSKEFLFLKETNDYIAIWEGEKLTKEAAFVVSGIEQVFWNKTLEKTLAKIIKKAKYVYLNKNQHSRSTSNVETRDDRFKKWCKKQYSVKTYLCSAPIMHLLRSIKSNPEINLIKEACRITELGFRRVLGFIKPGIKEYEIEAELIHEFIRNRSKGFAYEPIIASGKNACVLHYTNNNATCKKNEVVLLDAGAEYANYASDMTRCIPVNGKFSLRQKKIYSAVLDIMNQAIQMLKPGVLLKEYHSEVGNLMEKHLINLGLISTSDIKKASKKNPAYKKFFMHGTSHFLGLDVHDVGLWEEPIKEGMVFTCEPGIYIPKEGLGVRLENDILVTNKGVEDLMKNIPVEINEIEDLMN